MIQVSIQKQLRSSNGAMLLDLDLEIKKGSFLTLFGKSGAGKTTILRIIAGLLKPDKGQILVDNKAWFHSTQNINLPPQKRKVGFMFQDFALFPNMTALENLSFAKNKKTDQKIIPELIEVLELGDLQNYNSQELSGGEKQRVALARALVQKPEILLLDEPLSSLDTEMREKLQGYIIRLHQYFQMTTIMVSHDIAEIINMADNAVEIHNGKITRFGSPNELFVQKHLSGKFQFTGTIVAIEKQDVILVITVLVGKDLVKVIATKNTKEKLKIGDRVTLASKAFNPIIQKIS